MQNGIVVVGSLFLLAGSYALVGQVAAQDTPRIPERPASEWIRELESGQIERVEMATRALSGLGAQATPIIPDLIRILETDNPDNRRHVLAIIQALGPIAKDATPAIRKKLFHEDFHTQYWACRAIGAIGPEAIAAAPDLGKLLSTRYAASVRRNAALALGLLGPGIGRAGVEQLTDMLRDRNHPVRIDAALSLGALGDAAKPAIPELRTALLDKRRDMRVPTCVALWKITQQADDLLPVLMEEVREGSLPWEAAQAFGEFGAAAKPVVPQLIEGLGSATNTEQRATYLDALGAIGPAARSAEGAIRKYVDDEDEEVSQAAREALEKIGAPAPPAKQKDVDAQ
ncbi:MAG: HEAT repeat domain-containing protein [Pirellulales bacterium]